LPIIVVNIIVTTVALWSSFLRYNRAVEQGGRPGR